MGSHPVIYIRTDGNAAIATGHLMRCLTIARALKRRRAMPVFVVSDEASIRLLRGMMTPEELTGRSFPLIHMQTDYRDPQQEIPILSKILSEHRISCLLVDSYFVTPAYLEQMKKACKVAFLDDRQAFDPPANLVINYDLTVNTDFYQNGAQVLAGSAYTPLREQFSRHSSYHVWDCVRDLFVSTGGTDPYRVCVRILEHLLPQTDWADCRFHVLTGPLHAGRDALCALAKKEDRVILHEKVTEMADLMGSCDLAFCAGGTTLYELCAIGVPAVSCSIADNQIPGVKAFDRAGLIPWIGDIRQNPSFFDDAADALRLLAQSPDTRRERSVRMRLAIDGAGADRIADAILSL